MIVAEFLDKHNLNYRKSGRDQFVVEVCPLCGDSKWHFYIDSESGLWNCKKCDGSGNLWTLRRELEQVDETQSVSELLSVEAQDSTVSESLVGEYQEGLAKDQSAIEWLLNRGLTRDSIQGFKLGVVEEGSKKWLTIPYYLYGKPVNVKFRTLPPHEKSFKLLTGHLTPLYNVDELDTKQPVFLTEGEFDAISLIQQGYRNTVSLPLGAGTFSPEHFDSLVTCGKVNLLLDNDDAGRTGALRIAERLGPERCFVVTLPVKDANAFFLRFGKPDFEAILAEAKSIGTSSVLSLAETFRELYERRARRSREAEEEVQFPWPSVNRIVGTLRPGWLIVLQAVPFVGKSTFVLNTLLELARDRQVPSFFFCLEMNPVQLLERIISSHRGVRVDEIEEADIVMAQADLYRTPLYIGRSITASLTAERIFETIRYAVKRFGVRLVAFDHLHFLCRSIGHLTQEVGKVVRDFKLLLEELRVPGILITHPTKTPANDVPGLYGSRDSGEIAGDADVVMSLFRRQTSASTVREEDFTSAVSPTFEARTLVRVTASRFSPGGSAVLYFNGDSMRFEELTE